MAEEMEVKENVRGISAVWSPKVYQKCNITNSLLRRIHCTEEQASKI